MAGTLRSAAGIFIDRMIDELAKELGDTPPPSFAALGPRELETLTRVLATAREQQLSDLEAASDNALAIVPRLLRGAVKKVLFG
jgi:hypothetical protein